MAFSGFQGVLQSIYAEQTVRHMPSRKALVLVRNPNPEAAAYRGLALGASIRKSSSVGLVRWSHMEQKMAAPAVLKNCVEFSALRDGNTICKAVGGRHPRWAVEDASSSEQDLVAPIVHLRT